MPFGIGGNLSLTNTKGLSRSVKTAKLKGKLDPISAVTDIVGMVAPAIVGISYQIKNAQFQKQIEDNLQMLSDAQKEEIRDSLSKIEDSNERLSTLIKYLADNLGTQSALSLKSQIDNNLAGAVKNQTKMIYWFLGITAVALIGVYVIKKVRK